MKAVLNSKGEELTGENLKVFEELKEKYLHYNGSFDPAFSNFSYSI